MSRALFALAFLVSTLPLAAQPSAPHCMSVREQDPDTGAIVQKTHLAPASAPGSVDPLFVWTSDDPDSLMFAVVRNGEALRYAGCFDMTLQADGQPIPLTRLRHDKDPNSRRMVVEYVRAEIPWAGAQKLAQAKSITFTVCRDHSWVDEKTACEARHVIEVASRWRREQAEKK